MSGGILLPLRRLLRLGRDSKGAVAVEFAFIAPILILMYFAIAELTDGMIVKRRVSHVASTIADLTSRVSQVNTSDTNDIFSVGRTLITPLATTSLRMRLSSVTANSGGTSHVDWSDASNWTPYAVGATVTPPAAVISANQSIVMAEVQYTYNSPVRYLLPNGILLTQTYYLRPRISNVVVHN
jgi:Flp pilus assembly protein TadG